MYTTCPACRSEIKFEAPENAASLPEGYKHRIKCPNCGVTIAVKLNRVESKATYTPKYVEESSQATVITTVAAEPKRKKKSGVSRNIVVMLFSLLVVALNVIGYLIAMGTIKTGNATWLNSFGAVSGLKTIRELLYGTPMPTAPLGAIQTILPIVLFGLVCVNFVVAFFAAWHKKYGRAWNVVSAILILVVAALILVFPLINNNFAIANSYGAIAATAITALNFIFSLAFIKKL